MTKPEETVVLLETQRDGKRYLVVDCGDGNIYFTTHEVLEGGVLKTLYEAPKDNLGGKYVFLVSETGDLYFHFRDNLLSDMSDKVRIFLDLLVMLVLFSVYGGLLFYFRDNLMSEIPTWARIFLVLWILLVFSVHVGLLLFFRQNFMLVYRVEVDSGVESVLLPFQTSLRLPKEVQVTWTNSSDRIIHKAQGDSCGLLRLEEQDCQYADRTEMDETFTLGDLSLTLKNPTDRDTDSYTCTVSKKSGKILVKKKVLLNVKAGPDSLIVAIDFGSGFSGFAFNVKPREEGGGTQIKRWSNGLGLDTPKTPTCILFDEHEEFMKFGYEAKTAFTNMREEEEAQKHYFIENFNIAIQGKVSTTSRESLTVKVEVYKGEQFVVLPCQYSQVLEEILTVKWSRYDLSPN
ncbi:hypothetical protein CCH79_00020714, partial [Gambusia affinis]